MSKHTPGPWNAVQVGQNQWDINCSLGTVTSAYGKANADLIAASPKLYDSVLALLNLITNIEGEHVIWPDGYQEKIDEAFKVIQEIDGETK